MIEINLPLSKSISNRILSLLFLAKQPFPSQGLSEAGDTIRMQQLLEQIQSSKGGTIDAGDAGTVYRFLTSILSIQLGEWRLMGSERMHERPIAPLVEALLCLGADIHYQNEKGFPPLLIRGKKLKGGKVKLQEGLSSQYTSSLMMLGAFLPEGLELEFNTKDQVSFPYIELTADVMRSYNLEVQIEKERIRIPPSLFQDKGLRVEADWSAASYFYSALCLFPEGTLLLKNLHAQSAQGDAIIQHWYRELGIETTFTKEGALIHNIGNPNPCFSANFLAHPDLALSLALSCCALGIRAELSGLSTLAYKESNRLEALCCELKKLNQEMIRKEEVLILIPSTLCVRENIKTYQDHRMAMAFSVLSLRFNLEIEEKEVVRKSFPRFWNEFEKLKKLSIKQL